MPRGRKTTSFAKTLALYISVLLVLFIAGYLALNLLPAYGQADPVDEEDPTGEDPVVEDPPGDDPGESPAPVDGPGEDPGNRDLYPPEPGQILRIVDGDYLLALVTKDTYLGTYEPQDLEPLPSTVVAEDQRRWTYYLRREALEQMLAMVEAAADDGVELFVISAYRSYSTQRQIFDGYVAKHGLEATGRFSARPGHSEHQLGTTVDFNSTSSAFGETVPGRWLADNAYHYGFTLSYPPDSEHITGYIYEPWHFRYIGPEAALAWKSSGLIVHDYLQQQPQSFLE